MALVDGDAGAGLAVLGELDDRGRDVAVVLDQVVDHVRTELASSVRPDGDRARSAALARAAHRLAAIDPERRGVGGLRFQLELAILDAATRSVAEGPAQPVAAARSAGLAAAPMANTDASAGRAAVPSSQPQPEPEAEHEPEPEPAAEPGTTAAPPAAAPVARSDRSAPRPATAANGGAKPADPARPSSVAATGPATASEVPIATGGGASATGATGATADIDQLRAAWPEIVAVLSQSPPVKPLIAACRPVSVEGAVVTLGFPEDQAFLKNALERRQSMLEEGIGRVLGRAVNVRCVATNLEHVPAVPLGDGNDLISEARRIFADDIVDVGEVS